MYPGLTRAPCLDKNVLEKRAGMMKCGARPGAPSSCSTSIQWSTSSKCVGRVCAHTATDCSKPAQEKKDKDVSSLLCSLKASRSIAQVRRIHASAVETGVSSNVRIASSLIRMYAKCGSMSEAREVFDSIHHHDVVCWTALILGYVENGQGEVALGVLLQMHRSGCSPNARTFTAAFKACTVLAAKEPGMQVDGKMLKVKALEKGMAIHSQAQDFSSGDAFIGSTLVEMYSKCRSMVDAHRAFDGTQHRDVVLWTALMVGYVENEQYATALELLQAMQFNGCMPNSRSYVAALKACSSLAAREESREIDGGFVKLVALEQGMALHCQAAQSNKSGSGDLFVGNILIDMYSTCGSMVDARAVFDKMERHDVVSWTALLSGYAQNGDGDTALELFAAMKSEPCLPDARTFVALLKSCVALAGREKPMPVHGKLVKVCSLEKGMAIHCEASSSNCKFDVFLENTLIDMYSNCGSVMDFKLVFDQMQRRDVVSWNALMLGYVENSECKAALQMFSSMQEEGYKPNSRTFVAAVKACIGLALAEDDTKVDGSFMKIGALEKGMAIHSESMNRLCDSDVFVSSSLIDMYAKCGNMIDASKVFNKIDRPGVVPWTSLILGYAENGKAELALELFVAMQAEKCQPNSQTFAVAFKACAWLAEKEEFTEAGQGKLVKLVSLERAFALHSRAPRIENSADSSTVVVEMYAKCGSTVDARRVLDEMECWNPASWSALLVGHTRNGELNEAMELLSTMPKSRGGDPRTLAAALKACSSVGAWQLGRKAHAEICRCGLESNQVIATCLVDFYCKVGSVVLAQQVFDSMLSKDLVAWTALVAGYGRQGDAASMFESFHSMRDFGLCPDSFTFLSIISACSHAGLVKQGKECLYAMKTKYGICPGHEHYHGVIDLLGRINHLDEAMMVLESMPLEPNCVSWTTILNACKKWKNIKVGKIAYNALVKIDKRNKAAYTLMANLYGN
ncbi:pentatricopeptide repeat-containing protein At2g03380, mitochondrial-like isoform X2 [Selaginella moellendorffii]|nr:pentatricopeptide repeat-containing protein At2g03380, mitochondrial-like isoform X2 [Selaginella moellendorffii]|eukprot:XP_024536920.1 pentatricopeptide repeat-containing protein At2g03380, mitochondrial-like isoform X2 [Selaginella moellendorffii]